MNLHNTFVSRGNVGIVELPGDCRLDLFDVLTQVDERPQDLEALIQMRLLNQWTHHNLVFDFPRQEYAKLDRGESAAINARYLTMASTSYTDSSVETVSGESLRVAQTTQAQDPNNTKGSILRFILDVGQFVGTWPTAILIGGATATTTPGTGKIVAAVNNLLDDQSNPVVRSGSTLHLVNWNIAHLDASEVP